MKSSKVIFPTLIASCLLLTGCGKESSAPSSSASTSAEVDACTLLTDADIEAVTSVAPGESGRPNPGLNNCQWPTPGEVVPLVYIGLSNKAADSWDEYRQEMIENEFGDPEEIGERIDIGEFGFYIPDRAMIQVQSRQGSLITLRVRKGTREQLTDLASRAAARL
jgi:hypothetical protein